MEFDLNQIEQWLTNIGFRAFTALAIVIIGFWMSNKLKKVLDASLSKREIDFSLREFLVNITNIVLKVIFILAAISHAGFHVTSLLAVLGGAALGLGMGLQGSLSNFASGVLILLTKPFKTGDLIKSGEHMGWVEKIDLLYTTIIEPTHKTVIMPNANIFDNPVLNYSRKGHVRIDATVGISYNDDYHAIRRLLLEAVNEDKMFLRKTSTIVEIDNFGDSSIVLAIRAFARPQEYWDAYFRLNTIIKDTLNENGYIIPFPQRDLHIIDIPKNRINGS